MQEESPQRTVSICILSTKLSGRRRCTDNKKSTEREGEGYSWPQGQAAPRQIGPPAACEAHHRRHAE